MNDYRTVRSLAPMAVFLAMAPIAGADTITVTTFVDGVDSDANCSLREAILAANTDSVQGACSAGSGTDTIVLSAGTYTLDFVSEGDLDITDDVELWGTGSGSTSVAGGPGWAERIFDVAEGTSAVLWGLTVTGGRDPSSVGGGIRSLGHLELVDVVVTDNEAEFSGGGIAIENTGSGLLVDSRVSGNRINTGGQGPGLYLRGPTAFFDVEISDHSCDDCNGAGVYVQGADFSWHGGEATRNHAVVVAEATIGGALVLSGQSQGDPIVFSIRDLWVHDNSADVGGGLTFDGDGSTLRITNSTFENNAAVAGFNGHGAGLRLAGGMTELENVTLSGNQADEEGGGVYVSFSASLSARYVTFTQNRANADGVFSGQGGGLAVQNGLTGTVILEASILDGNLVGDSATTVGSQCADRDGSVVTSAGFNLQSVFVTGHPLACDFAATGDQQGTPGTPLDTGIDPNLADNGGSTPTHALLPGSPALDAIPAGQAGCASDVIEDQRRAPRASGTGLGGDGCDIGPFEADSPPLLFADGFESGYPHAWTSLSP